MSKRMSYEYVDMPLSGRNLRNERPCRCESLRKALRDVDDELMRLEDVLHGGSGDIVTKIRGRIKKEL